MRKLMFFLALLITIGAQAANFDDKCAYYDVKNWIKYTFIGDGGIVDIYKLNSDYESKSRLVSSYYLVNLNVISETSDIAAGNYYICTKKIMEVDKPSHKEVDIVLWTPTGNVRWEKSVDNGVTWENIENTNPWYEEMDPERGTALYRTLDPDGTYSNVVTIHYYDEIPETIATVPDNVTKSVEESVTFTADVTDDDYTYQWYLNGRSITGATGREYTVESIMAKDAGTYTCDVTNPVGEVTTLPATLAVNKISQVITFPEIEAKTFGDPDFILPETTDKGLKIVYQSSNKNVASVNGNTVHIVAPGETIITANQAGSADYLEAAYVSRKLVVNKRRQTIDFPAPDKKRFGDLPFQLPASTDEGLPISYKVINTKVASITGNTVTILNAGQTEIVASQSGDATRYEATPVTQTLIVDKANQTITFAPIGAKIYGDASITLNEVTDAALPIKYSVEGESVKIENGNTLVIVRPGTSVVTAEQEGSENYNAATTVSQTINVSKAPQTIHWDNIPNLTYGDADVVLPEVSDKGLTLTYTSSNDEVATVEGNTLKVTGAGQAEITASQEGDEFYNEAASITLPVNVSKAYQTISFPEVPELTYGMEPITLGAIADSSSQIRYESSNPKVVSIENDILTVNGAGACHVTAYANGDNNYYDASPVSREIIVNKASQIVTFEEIEDLTYGISPFTLVASSSTGKAMTFKSSDSKVIGVNGSLATVRGAGNVVLTATQSGDDNYNPESISITVNVNKASLIVRAEDATRLYGEENPQFAVIYSGFVNGDGEEELDDLPIVECAATVKSNVGSYNLKVSKMEDRNYNIIPQTGTLTVTKAPLTITAEDASRLYAEQNPELTYTVTGFKNEDTERDLLSLPALYTDAKTGSSVGEYPIIAEGGDARNYELIHVDGVLTIEKAPLTATLQDYEREYGLDNDPEILLSGFRRNETESVVSMMPEVESEADCTSDTGEYRMTLSGGEAENYYFTYEYPEERDYAMLTVTKAPLTITAEDQIMRPEDQMPQLTLRYEGFRNDDTEDSLDQWPYAEVVNFMPEIGEYPIVLSGGYDHNYEYTLVPGTLKVSLETGVGSVDDNTSFIAYAVNGTIYITGISAGERVGIYSTSGMLLFTKICDGNLIDFNPGVSGVYIVTDGRTSAKITL